MGTYVTSKCLPTQVLFQSCMRNPGTDPGELHGKNAASCIADVYRLEGLNWENPNFRFCMRYTSR
jgi:hypothetical protein